MANKSFSYLLALFLLLPCSQYAMAQESLSDEDIKGILQERIDTLQRGVGIVVGIVDADGRRIIGHGDLKLDGGQEPDGNTVFEIGSISKPFTALLLADMVERGELNLEDPVVEFLPESVVVPTLNERQITLLDLVTHRSGLPRNADNLDSEEAYAGYSAEQTYEFLKSYTPTRNVGTQFEYSNVGLGLLGHVLSLAAGTDYATLLQERILTPLEMEDTAIALSSALEMRLAEGHSFFREPVPNLDLGILAGAGGLRSTAGDMLQFLAANVGLVPSDLSAAMDETHIVRNSTETPGLDIGLSWLIFNIAGKRIIWHDGATFGYRSFTGFDKASQTGVIVLSNSAHDISDIGLHLLDRRLPLAVLDPLPTLADVDPLIYGDYVGDYELAPEFILSVTQEDDILFVQATDQLKLPVFPSSETEFFYTIINAQITFFRDEQGMVSHLVIRQNGVENTARKLPSDITAIVEEGVAGLPTSFVLEQNYPNPFNSQTVVRFALAEPGEVELTVYNMNGQKVATLAEGGYPAGQYTVGWDGQDDQGQSLASGTYLLLLQSGGKTQMRKSLLLR